MNAEELAWCLERLYSESELVALERFLVAEEPPAFGLKLKACRIALQAKAAWKGEDT